MLLIDSTRSGKRLPDALSKTVPIWCSVVNRASLIRAKQLRRDDLADQWDISLYTPPGSVSPQEHAQIDERLDEWATTLAVRNHTPEDYQLCENSIRYAEFFLHVAGASFSSSPPLDNPSYINLPIYRARIAFLAYSLRLGV